MIGHSLDDTKTALEDLMVRIGATNVDDVLQYLGGKSTQGRVRSAAKKGLDAATFGKMTDKVNNFAGSRIGRGLARAVPALSAIANIGAMSDIVAGNEGIGNKAMDATALMGATALGARLGGPLGASLGMNAGKIISDGVQGIFGDGKSPEQRKLEEALLALKAGR